MTSDELRSVIATLWPGHGGQTRAAEHFSINNRRIREYLADTYPVPEWMAAEIADLLEAFPDGVRCVDPTKTIAVLQKQMERSGLSASAVAASILGTAIAHARCALGTDAVAELLDDA